MQQEHNRAAGYPKAAKIICWLLTAACMCVIFWLSSRTADESSAQSDIFVELLQRIFGDGLITEFIVRKGAHFCEYAGLGFLFALSFYIQFGKTRTPAAVLCVSAYAVTDELHQLFVDRRACRAADWAIDTAGAILGATVLLLAVLICKMRAEARENKAIRN